MRGNNQTLLRRKSKSTRKRRNKWYNYAYILASEYLALKYVFVDFPVPNLMIIWNFISKFFIYLFLVENKHLSLSVCVVIHDDYFDEKQVLDSGILILDLTNIDIFF